jgi:hypothetical protein
VPLAPDAPFVVHVLRQVQDRQAIPVSTARMGSSIDDFLKEEGIFEKAQAQAVKEVVAWQRRGRPAGGAGNVMLYAVALRAEGRNLLLPEFGPPLFHLEIHPGCAADN